MKLDHLAPKHYLAFVLGDKTVAELRRRYPPKYPRVITHHVTMAFDPTSFEGVHNMFDLGDLEIYALAYVDGEISGHGIDGFLVSIEDRVERVGLPGKYHVTHSVTPPLKPVNTNDLLHSKNARYDYFDKPLKLHGRVEQVKL